MTEKRKIIQITGTSDEDSALLYALADDGTLWKGQNVQISNAGSVTLKFKFVWKQMPGLPE